MVDNLLRELQDGLGGQLAKQASSFLGADEAQTTSALSGILPTILGGLAKTASSGNGAASIFDFIKDNNIDGSLLNNVGGMFSDPSKSSGMMDMGGALLKMVLGNNSNSILDTIASFSGMKKESTSSLMSIAGPILMSLIGRKISNKGLNIAGLASLLMGQKDFIKAALPAGLSGISDTLGFDAIGNKQAETVTAAAKKDNSRGWLMPLLIGGVAILGLFYLMRGCGGTGIAAVDNAADAVIDKTEQAAKGAKDGVAGAVDATGDALKDGASAVATGAGDLADGAKDMADKAGEMAENALDATTKAAREALASIKFAAGSAGEKMNDFFKGEETEATFTFKNLTFDTGSADLQQNSLEYLNQVVAIMNAYPNSKITVVGHTDNTGDAGKNEALSLARANSVKNYIERQGIATERITAEGKGGVNPVATNSTAEGRAENRRIEIRVNR